MQHYLDLSLLPDPELATPHLMAGLYTRLHHALVEMRASTIGVSLPGYRKKPPACGSTLRLIGPEEHLAHLMAQPWLRGMRDHTSISAMQPVPEQASHRGLRRVQVKSNVERIRRRQMRRHGLSEQQAREQIPEQTGQQLTLPFVMLSSGSTGQRFPLFLDLEPPVETPQKGTFNTYGLSNTATIPWF